MGPLVGAYGCLLRLLVGLSDGQEDLVSEVRHEPPPLHRLLGGEVDLLGQLHGGGVQTFTEECERLDSVADGEMVGDELLPVLVADVSGLVDELGAAGALGHVLGDEVYEASAQGTQTLALLFGHAGEPGGAAAAALEAAAGAGAGDLAEGGGGLPTSAGAPGR